MCIADRLRMDRSHATPPPTVRWGFALNILAPQAVIPAYERVTTSRPPRFVRSCQHMLPQKPECIFCCTVFDHHDVAIACQETRAAAAKLGLGLRRRAAVATSVAELATNLLLHAGGGRIEIRRVTESWRVGIEVVATDSGPGIPDVQMAMRDGFTTRGGLGSGLPAVQRLMGDVEVSTEVGRGTVVRATMWSALSSVDPEESFIDEVGAISQRLACGVAAAEASHATKNG